MKIAIVSDIHANYEALRLFPEASAQASCAVWEDGHLRLKRYSYPLQTTVTEIRTMPISAAVQDQSIELITTGDLRVEKV